MEQMRLGRLLPFVAALLVVAAACGDTAASTAPTSSTGESGLSQELPPDSGTTPEGATPEAGDPDTRELASPVTDGRDASNLVPATVRPVPEKVSPSPAPAPTPAEVPPSLEGLVAEAKQMLIDAVGATENDIVVASAEFAVWPDASLGCPQPGIEYIQVLVEGSKVELFYGDFLYSYHSDGNRVVHCS